MPVRPTVASLSAYYCRLGGQERGKEILPTPHLNTDHADGGSLYAIGRARGPQSPSGLHPSRDRRE